MYHEALQSISEAAVGKAGFLRRQPLAYVVAAMLAGIYVGVGVFLALAVGAPLAAAGSPWLKTLMGAVFGIALSLVIFAGGELFTGTNMTLPIGWWRRRVSGRAVAAIWGASWLGNFAGAVLLVVLLHYSGVLNGEAERTLVQTLAVKKMHLPAVALLTRGILCNFLVCLGVWCAFRMKSEAGKLIMICWCLFAFVATGFEHSVANMTLLSLAMMQTPLPEFAGTLNIAGMAHNLVWVTLGNIIGGMVLVGGAYWLASGREEIAAKETPEAKPMAGMRS